MKTKNDETFIKQVENLIDPAEVCDLYFFQRFKKLFPKRLFKSLLERTSRKNPYIGFIIEPYSLFLFFKLRDIERAKSMLPDRYELVPTSIFADEPADYYQGMGIFNTKGSTFWGSRLETYLVVRDRETGLISWIFIDILSNTLIALPREGVADRNCAKALYTTSSRGDVYVSFTEDRTGRTLELKGNILNGVKRPLDQPLWVNGNTSIAFVKDLADKKDDPFAVIFDPAEVETALDIPLSDVDLRANTLHPGLAEAELCRVLCFPFAQHYIADSPGCRTYVKDEADMIRAYERISALRGLKTFSTKNVRLLFLAGVILSGLANILLFILLLA